MESEMTYQGEGVWLLSEPLVLPFAQIQNTWNVSIHNDPDHFKPEDIEAILQGEMIDTLFQNLSDNKPDNKE